MTIDYFKTHIKDEIDGAKLYKEKAVKIKTLRPDWSRAFIRMAHDELNHAKCLKKMFCDMYGGDPTSEYLAAKQAIEGYFEDLEK